MWLSGRPSVPAAEADKQFLPSIVRQDQVFDRLEINSASACRIAVLQTFSTVCTMLESLEYTLMFLHLSNCTTASFTAWLLLFSALRLRLQLSYSRIILLIFINLFFLILNTKESYFMSEELITPQHHLPKPALILVTSATRRRLGEGG